MNAKHAGERELNEHWYLIAK